MSKMVKWRYVRHDFKDVSDVLFEKQDTTYGHYRRVGPGTYVGVAMEGYWLSDMIKEDSDWQEDGVLERLEDDEEEG